LVSGTAELFGADIVPKQTYTFIGTKAAIFTYHSATLSIRGSPSVAYIAEETPMMSYANLHFLLEKLRQHAEDDHSQGPRVLILCKGSRPNKDMTRIDRLDDDSNSESTSENNPQQLAMTRLRRLKMIAIM
jgi:hypothetical protein